MKSPRSFAYAFFIAAFICFIFAIVLHFQQDEYYNDKLYLEPGGSPNSTHQLEFHAENETKVHLTYEAEHDIQVFLKRNGSISYEYTRRFGREFRLNLEEEGDYTLTFVNPNENGTDLWYSMITSNQVNESQRTIFVFFTFILLMCATLFWVNSMGSKRNSINETQDLAKPTPRIHNPPPPAYLSGFSSSSPPPPSSATTDMFSPPPPKKLKSPASEPLPDFSSSLPTASFYPPSPSQEPEHKSIPTKPGADNHLSQEDNQQ